MATNQPFDPKVFIVQHTEPDDLTWKEDQSFESEKSAQQRADQLRHGEHKPSARVLKIVYTA